MEIKSILLCGNNNERYKVALAEMEKDVIEFKSIPKYFSERVMGRSKKNTVALLTSPMLGEDFAELMQYRVPIVQKFPALLGIHMYKYYSTVRGLPLLEHNLNVIGKVPESIVKKTKHQVPFYAGNYKEIQDYLSGNLLFDFNNLVHKNKIKFGEVFITDDDYGFWVAPFLSKDNVTDEFLRSLFID